MLPRGAPPFPTLGGNSSPEFEAPVLEIASKQDVFSHLSAGMNIADDPHSRAKAIWRWIGG